MCSGMQRPCRPQKEFVGFGDKWARELVSRDTSQRWALLGPLLGVYPVDNRNA